MQFLLSLVKIQVHDHPSRREVIYIAIRCKAQIQGSFQDHQQTYHSDTLTLSVQ